MTTGADEQELAAWLRLTQLPGLGLAGQRQLLSQFGLPTQILQQSPARLQSCLTAAQSRQLLQPDPAQQEAIEQALAWARQPGNRILTLADADYPKALLEGDDPPTLLYAKGRLELLQRPALALVGSRNATPQGLRDAEAFAGALASAGLVIVSGLALGIDTAAHGGALAVGGATIAVIGTGADRIYPARNQALAHRIASEGLLLSEFALGTPPLTANFPRRNRLIAGLSQGCLVVEAAARSGSLITARLAAEAGREVYAIPGSIHSPLAKGCHQLIRQGAKLVESAADVLEELPAAVRSELPRWQLHAASPQTDPTMRRGRARAGGAATVLAGKKAATRTDPALPAATDAGDGARVSWTEAVDVHSGSDVLSGPGAPVLPAAAPAQRLLQLLGEAPCDLDQLVQYSGLTAEAVLAILLPLELEGWLARLPGGRYQRLHPGPAAPG